MHRPFLVLAIIFVIALSSACASKKPRPQAAIYFSTSITQDGGKFFVYSLEAPERAEREGRKGPPKDKKGGGGGKERGEGRSPDSGPERSGRDKDALKQRVDVLIATNRYCRDGYVVLDQYAGAGMASLRGECRDGATPEDRSRFRNPV